MSEDRLAMSENLPPHELPKATPMPRRRQITILAQVAVVAIIVVVAVIVLRGMFTPKEEAPVAQEPGTFTPTKEQIAGLKIAPVALAPFHSQDVTDGKIATSDDTTTPVFSPFTGQVTRLIAKPGDIVKRGDPLFAIAASEFVQAQNDLVSAVAGLKTADAQLKLAEANEKRQHELYEAKGGALKDWLQSQSDLVNAESNHRTAEIALAAVRNRLVILGKSERDITLMEAAPQTTRTSPEATVPAPIGGTIIQRQVSVGQYINSAAGGASAPVYQIGNLSTVWLVAAVREVDAPAMRVGEPVDVSVLAFPNRVFKARLAYVGSVVDDTTRRVAVRAEVENLDGVLKPEMFATFRIVTSDDSMAPGAPESAVVYEGDAAHVWVVRDDGKVVYRAIRTGRTLDGLVEVLDGLKAGEKIVTSGTLFIDRAAENA
jgi:cobalt-zinc-cadmium efflux system membrane fusion protein